MTFNQFKGCNENSSLNEVKQVLKFNHLKTRKSRENRLFTKEHKKTLTHFKFVFKLTLHIGALVLILYKPARASRRLARA